MIEPPNFLHLELTSGEISQYSLWQRLTAPGLSLVERDIITSALNFFNSNNNPNGSSGIFPKQIGTGNLMMKPPATIPMPQGSPLSPVPLSLDQHLLFQHQAAAVAANKLRLSPLPAAGKINSFTLFRSFRFWWKQFKNDFSMISCACNQGFPIGPAVLPPNNTLTLHVPGIILILLEFLCCSLKSLFLTAKLNLRFVRLLYRDSATYSVTTRASISYTVNYAKCSNSQKARRATWEFP